jgi:predicted acylesterase/phospholipase RssA
MAKTEATGQTTEPQPPITLQQLVGAMPAFALSGGASHGDFEVGAVRYLYNLDIRPKILTGTSVGSINALKLAEGEDDGKGSKVPGHIRGLAGLEAIWHGLRQDSDMWIPDPTLAPIWKAIDAIVASGPDVKAAFDQLTGTDADSIAAATALSTLGLFPASQATLAYAAVKADMDAGTIETALKKAFGSDDLETAFQDTMTQLENALALTNLDPIYATMKKPTSMQPSDVKSSGIKLRLAMVALEDGALRYVNEDGILLERDGTPTPSPLIAAPSCGDPIHKKLDPLLQQLATIQAEFRGMSTMDSNGHPINNGTKANDHARQVKALQAQITALQKALAACPRLPGPPVKVDLRFAALASSSIPVVFPPQEIAGMNYVDGGIRTIVPIDAALDAGATMVFAVAASGPKIDIDNDLLPPWEMLKIALRVSETIMISEITSRDLFPRLGFGVPVLLIRPEEDIHSSMAVDPGLINIRMAHGFMRADDVVEAYLSQQRPDIIQTQLVARDPYAYLKAADRLSAKRNTLAIAKLRRAIWDQEFVANGMRRTDEKDFPPAAATVQEFGGGGPGSAAFAKVKAMKLQLKALVEARIKAGGKCPDGYEKWWEGWEAHNWLPFAYHSMKTSITPKEIPTSGTTQFTVHATDVDDGKAITDANVEIDGVKKGTTGQPISFMFKRTMTVDPKTKAKDIDFPTITVTKNGYQPAVVEALFEG